MSNGSLNTGTMGKALILLGSIILCTGSILFILTPHVFAESHWKIISDGKGSWAPGIFAISALFILGGGFMLFIHRQFVKLSDVAQDVLSGKYEEEMWVPDGQKDGKEK